MKNLEEDAWMFEIKTPVGILQKTFQKHPEKSGNDFDWIEGTDQALYTSKTIKKQICRVVNEMMENEKLGLSEKQDDAVAEMQNKLNKRFS